MQMMRQLRLVQASACLAGFCFGYDTSIIATTLEAVRDEFQLSSALLGLFVSIALFGAVVGSIFGGQVADEWGRPNVIFVADIGFVLGALCMALAPVFPVLLLGRFLVGLAIGSSAVVVPVFLAELAELASDDTAQVARGSFVGMNVVYITFGQLVAYVVGFLLYPSWRTVLGSAVLPAIVQAMAFHSVSKRYTAPMDPSPSSPNREDIVPIWRNALDLWQRREVRTGIRLHVLQQASGINAVMYWSPLLVASAWSGTKEAQGEATTRLVLLASMIPVAVNCAGSWLSMALVDRGRRTTLLASLAGSITIMAMTSLAFALDAGGLPVVFMLSAFVAAYSVGLGSIPWLVSELFAPSIRAQAASLCAAANWTANMLFTQAFAMIDPSLAFLLTAIASASIGWSLVSNFPEAAGISLDEASTLLS